MPSWDIGLVRRGSVFPPPVVVYSGPGDVVAGAVGWWGLRAYTSALAGSNAIRIRRVSDNTEQDFTTIAGTGALDVASIATFLSATSGRIVTWYDQAGTNNLTQATAASQAAYNATGIGSLPSADFVSANSDSYATVSVVTQAQPFTLSFVSKVTTSGSTRYNLFGCTNSNVQGGYNLNGNAGGNNTQWIFAGSGLSAAATDNAYHALQDVFNGASSDVNVDGSVNTGNPLTDGFASAFNLGHTGGLFFLQGSVVEVGLWGSAFTSTQSSNMSSNQHAYWGF